MVCEVEKAKKERQKLMREGSTSECTLNSAACCSGIAEA